MSKSTSAEGDDVCPICLEPLPPFWDIDRRTMTLCCGKEACRNCHKEQFAYVIRTARAKGSWGKEEDQLADFCPMCRSKNPADGSTGRMLADKFEKGQLPLVLHRELGVRYLKGIEGLEKNLDKGLEMLMLGAEKGDPRCSFVLGTEYSPLGNHGVPKSPAEAKRWFLVAAEKGHAHAEYTLAIRAKDEGNDAEYLRYLRSSAAKGYGNACYNLGVAYSKGIYGLPTSGEDVIRVLTPTAEGGHVESMGLLGLVMCGPPGHRGAKAGEPDVPDPVFNPNFVKGMHWLRKGAEGGNAYSASVLKGLEGLFGEHCCVCKKKEPQGKAFLRCSRCRAAWYCSKDCQVVHWRALGGGHKDFCIKWVSSKEPKKA